MKVSNIQLQHAKGRQRLSADLDGFQLWYAFPDNVQILNPGDVFLVAAVLPCMLAGKELSVDSKYTVSPKLLTNLDLFQSIFQLWEPRLRKIPIRARIRPPDRVTKGRASFFSGGVDSMHTFFRHQDEIGFLIFIRGFDFALDNEVLGSAATKSNESFSSRYAKSLISVDTNVRDLM